MLGLLPVGMLSLILETSQAQTNFQQILSLGALPQSGSSPRAQLLEGSDGSLYGTTYGGGTGGSGSLFKIRKDGSGFTTLHSFTGTDFPCSGLVEAGDGSLCGTTPGGGSSLLGTVFKVARDGSGFTVLHAFPSGAGDGEQPVAGLAKGSSGVLYGTTFGGGSSHRGTVYRLNADGSGYSALHSFAGTTNAGDGSFPYAGLCCGPDEVLYGTTRSGGHNDQGTLFKLNPDGSGYAVLHHFSAGPNDGRMPLGGLVRGSDGFLYGTTYYGGAGDLGTIFRLDTNGGNYAVLRSFTSASEGIQPFSGLVAGNDDFLYGTARYGGVNDGGTVFRIHSDGTGYTVLHRFSAIAGDGSEPLAPLLIGSDGALYGSTYWGGAYATNGASGTLFRIFSSPAQVIATSITPGSSGCLITFARGAAAAEYDIQATASPTSLLWETLGSATAAIDGSFQFLDTAGTNLPTRLYRSATK